jgi:hypothetical protein
MLATFIPVVVLLSALVLVLVLVVLILIDEDDAGNVLLRLADDGVVVWFVDGSLPLFASLLCPLIDFVVWADRRVAVWRGGVRATHFLNFEGRLLLLYRTCNFNRLLQHYFFQKLLNLKLNLPTN